MKNKWMGICDLDAPYVFRLADYLEEKKIFPFEIHVFTEAACLTNSDKANEAELMIISETVYTPELESLFGARLIILNESGAKAGAHSVNINKYQGCGQIVKEIMDSMSEGGIFLPPRLSGGNKLKVIGNYSPIKRCLQTTFSLCLGQLLAKKHKTLYVNFESFSGFQYLLQKEYKSDITDLLYYFNCDREKLAYRMESLVEHINGLDYIPPVMTYDSLVTVSAVQWKELFQEIGKSTEYEFLILDLTEHIQGLYDILADCCRVYTITREDKRAIAKIRQYEMILEDDCYREIAEKTRKHYFPLFKQIPENPELLTHGDLAEYVKKIVKEDFNEQTG